MSFESEEIELNLFKTLERLGICKIIPVSPMFTGFGERSYEIE